MRINIITAFPEAFTSFLSQSIVKRAIENKLLNVYIFNLRDFATDKRKTIDGRPFGGGPGMLLLPEPIYKAILKTRGDHKDKKNVFFLSPQGKLFKQDLALKLSRLKEITLVCGHYEGFDERIVKHFGGMEVSIGDFVLSGGEAAALVIVDAVTRLIPGVLGDRKSLDNESFTKKGGKFIFDFPQFTKPRTFNNISVPKILLSGNHEKIEAWRQKEGLKKLKRVRPDLLS